MSSLDKALDDVIKDNRRNNRQSGRSDQKSRRQQSNFGSSGGGIRKRTTGPRNTRNGGGGGGGPIGSKIIRTVNVRNPTGGSRFGGRGNSDKQWTHDKFDDRDDGSGGRGRSLASRLGGRLGSGVGGRQNEGGEIKIENLHYNVVEKDLQDLFELVGRVEKTRILFDRSGRSTGSAFVKFGRRSDAEAAIEKYNNVELDGQAMTIQMAPERRGGAGGSGGGRPQSSFGGGRGGRRGGGNSGRDRRNNDDGGKKKRSEADLDSEMDAYMKTTTTNDGEQDDNQMLID